MPGQGGEADRLRGRFEQRPLDLLDQEAAAAEVLEDQRRRQPEAEGQEQGLKERDLRQAFDAGKEEDAERPEQGDQQKEREREAIAPPTARLDPLKVGIGPLKE